MRRHTGIACTVLAAVVMAAIAGGQAKAPGGRPGGERGDRDYAERIYRGLLGRDPGPAELEATLRALSEAPYRVVVHNRLIDSSEFSERVSGDAFLVGLVSQIKGRAPLLHEMLVGRHYLREGVPRSELLGHLVQPRLPVRSVTPPLAALYDAIHLDFGDRNLARYTRLAGTYEAE